MSLNRYTPGAGMVAEPSATSARLPRPASGRTFAHLPAVDCRLCGSLSQKEVILEGHLTFKHHACSEAQQAGSRSRHGRLGTEALLRLGR